ncbi:MAG: helix-turn-helix domain-containing protein, partial [Alistipes sp.]|nr:helix-turn-helix domain-containing protein [Alistipes sp.]
MNHRFLFVFIALVCLAGSAQAQMTDNQVMEYVVQGLSAGKSQQQIGKELLIRGVSMSQIEKLKKRYEESGADITALSQGSDLRGTTSASQSTMLGSQRSDLFRDVSNDDSDRAPSSQNG